MKKAIQLLIVLLLMLSFRGLIFRTLISYNDIGSRPHIELTDKNLINEIELLVATERLRTQDIIKITNRLTTSTLSFTTSKAFRDPNKLAHTPEANCIGYAAMFTSIATYIIRNQKLHEEIEVYHKIGKLELLGIDLHQFSNHPFLKEHDFNVIRDIKTDQTIGVDASVNEYMGFQTVHLGKQL